jgi:2-polyprenyl-6-methoxyphenol hydroxylase-like FAD-dependent oxidoreductase
MRVDCCIAGGGPAGVMLGLLLARAGVDVVVLEKHADFLRDFRGDTVHPSTLEVIRELGLLESFLARPHQKMRQIAGEIAGRRIVIADFSHVPATCRFIALMPQWHFLDFLVEHARAYPTFRLLMQAEVTDLIRENDRVAGVVATTTAGRLEVRSSLVVGADGRHSVVRERAGLVVENLGAPIDVLWMRLSRRPDDPGPTLGYISGNHILVMLDRGDYWQCGFVIPKGAFDAIRARGIDSFRAQIATIVPFMRDRVGELKGWDDIKLLTVLVDRLREWYRPGLLCIGDAAHAMSPVGGVGINLAIQDAVAAANLLSVPLRLGHLSVDDLRAVQRRREFPTRMTQRLQVFIHNRVLSRALVRTGTEWPLVLKLVARWPILRRIPARFVGVGFRPEHVRSPVADHAKRDARGVQP